MSRSRPILLAAAFAAFGLIPLVLLAVVAVGTGGNAVKVNVKASLSLSVRLSALYVQSELTGLGEVTQSYARRPSLVKVLERSRRGERRPADASYLRLMLRQLRAVRPGIGTAFLADANGKLLDIVPATPSIIGKNFRFRDWYQGVARTDRVYISESYQSQATGRPQVVAVAAPVMTVGPQPRRIGIVVAAYDVAHLQRLTVEAARAQGLDVEVTDQRGVAIASHRGPLTSMRDDPLIAAALAGRSGVGERGVDDERQLAAYAPISKVGWAAMALVPARTAYAPVTALRNRVFLITLLLASLLLTGAWVLARMLRQRYRAEESMASALKQAGRLAATNRLMIVEMEEQNQRLREVDRLKDEFVALVSHELRTPLTSIVGYVSALKRGRAGSLMQEQLQLLEVVERNSQRLIGLVSDLLVAAKADAGKLKLEQEIVALDRLLGEALDSARPLAGEKGIELTATGSATAVVFADRARILQVLDNLISNAVKFTPPGGHVNVALSTVGTTAKLSVEDTGIGIPAEEQDKLFTRFFRASTAVDREIQGTGLGLSIVKTLIELHGGTIALESREGTGTTFTITLPLASAGQAAA